MNKQNILLWIGMFILLIGTIYFYLQYSEARKMQETLTEMLNRHISSFSTFENNRIYELNQGGTLVCGEYNVYDANNVQYKLTNVLQENTLVLRYSTNNCSTCIEEQVERLKAFQDSLNIDHIIFLSTYESNLYMGRYIKMNKIVYKVYNMSPELGSQIMDIGMPYYFVINRDDLRINKMFVPMKEHPSLTDRYLRSVRLRYFDK